MSKALHGENMQQVSVQVIILYFDKNVGFVSEEY